MKIKKILFLSILLMMILLFIPNRVNAEDMVEMESVFINLDNIKLGGKGQESTHAIGGSHFSSPKINITWYESANGNNYTLMEEDSKFDYNIYYKAVLDTSYDELNGMMDEGWELGGLSIHIVDETGKEVSNKSYGSNSKLEYVFEPFWKYSVILEYLENMEYIGPTEIVEGEKFVGQLVPKKNYKLPNKEELGYIDISVDFVNNYTGAFDEESGYIEIEPWHITGNIYIKAIAVEKEKIEFNNNSEYIYVKDNNNLDFAVSFEQHIDTLYINEKIVSDNDYSFDSENGILTLNESFLNTLEVGTYVLRIENRNRYAETNFSVKELEIVETYKVTFDANGGKFTDNDKIVVDDIINFDYANFNKPTREGYRFVGFFTEKTGGKSFEEIMSSEEGIKSDITFYAQWEEITTEEEPGILEGEEGEEPGTPEGEEGEEQEDNSNTGNTNQDNTNTGADNNAETGNNPQTSDSIILYVLILSISIFGIIITTRIRKIR